MFISDFSLNLDLMFAWYQILIQHKTQVKSETDVATET